MGPVKRAVNPSGSISNCRMEQKPNPYISPELSMLFRYFFMRKLWFAQPAQALIVFPGGFGTMDEMFEFLTLIQTHKMGHRVKILLYGSKFWKSVSDSIAARGGNDQPG